jgi:uncharacterized protein YndB with AHSA1/START domain
MLAKPSVTLKRHINGTPEQVFGAWTDPKKIVRWFGPQQTLADTVKAELDVRTGGKFWVSFNTDDGEFHKVGGTYRDVFPHERLQFSWAWHSTPERESLVTITLRPDGDGTMLTLLHEQFFDQAAADGHKRGWTGTLDKLAAEFA